MYLTLLGQTSWGSGLEMLGIIVHTDADYVDDLLYIVVCLACEGAARAPRSTTNISHDVMCDVNGVANAFGSSSDELTRWTGHRFPLFMI